MSGYIDTDQNPFIGRPWQPSDFGSALKLWVRSDLGITLNAGNVSAWADQSGNGNDLTQATPASQFPYVAAGAGNGGANGRAYLLGTNTGAHELLTAGPVVQDPFEQFIVARSNQNDPGTGQYLIDMGTNQGELQQLGGTDALIQYYGTGVVNSAPITPNADFYVDSYYHGAASTTAINGGAVNGPADPGTSLLTTGITFGNYGAVAFREWGGFIYELFIIDRQATAAELLMVDAYINNLYGIP